MRSVPVFPLAVALLILAAAPAVADEAASRPERRLFDLGLESLVYAEDGADGFDVASARFGIGISTRVPLGDGFAVMPSLEYTRYEYRFDGLSDEIPGGGDGPEGLEEFGLGIWVTREASAELAWFAMLRGKIAGETGADPADSFTAGAIVGARYAPREGLVLTAGIGAFTRLEDDPLIVPALGLRWTFADGFTLDLGFPRIRAEYAATEELDLFLGLDFDYRDFRLEGDGPLEGAALRDDAIGLSLGARYDLGKSARLELAAGWTLFRRVAFDDARGDELLEERLDGSPFLALGLTLRF